MKTNISVYFNTLLLLFILHSSCLAGAVGGGGISIKHKLTPYHKNKLQHVDNVNIIRSESHFKRIAEIPSIGNCQYIYLNYDRFGEPTEPELFVRGVNLNTGAYEKINFGEIETIEILESQPPYVTLKLKIFPCITPKALIDIKPTYLELVEKYTLFKTLRIKTTKYSDLSFRMQIKCTEIYGSSNKIFLDEIAQGTIIKFSFDLKKENPPIWWAIDSVTNDDSYPYYHEEFIGPVPSAP